MALAVSESSRQRAQMNKATARYIYHYMLLLKQGSFHNADPCSQESRAAAMVLHDERIATSDG